MGMFIVFKSKSIFITFLVLTAAFLACRLFYIDYSQAAISANETAEGIQGGSAVRMRKAVPKAADVAFVAYDVVE